MAGLISYTKKLLHLDLPRRELAIRFSVPSTLSDAKKPDLLSILVFDKIDDQKDSINYLKMLQKQARQLVQCSLGTPARASYTRKMVQFFYPVALKLASKHSKNGGVPDPELRQVTLDLMIDITSRLIDSYKLVFKMLYQGPQTRLAMSYKDFILSAFRILELTKFKQKLKGLRYQSLSEAAWLTVNNVFHAMLALGKCNEPMPLLENVLKSNQPDQTLTDLFIAIQTSARLDILKWPTEWQSFIDNYSDSAEQAVQINPDNGKDLNRNLSISYAYDNGPSRSGRAGNGDSLGPSAFINWQKLNQVITSDTQMFSMGKSQHEKLNISNKFAMLTYTESMAIVKLQMEIFRGDVHRTSSEDKAWEDADMRMYIGFWSVYELLDNIFYPLHSAAVGTRLADSLAQRSATLAEDHVATHASLWSMQARGDQEVMLKTQETQFTTGMRIGSLIAFGVGDEGAKRPNIGVISRMCRPASRNVIVDLEKFGKSAEPVMVTPDLTCVDKIERNGKQTVHAILVRYDNGKSTLLLPPDTGFGEKSRLMMKRNKQIQMIALGKIEDVTKDFSLFPLVSP
jgi:hypothetical protein